MITGIPVEDGSNSESGGNTWIAVAVIVVVLVIIIIIITLVIVCLL